MDYKNIHIGNLLKIRVEDSQIDITRICNFMKCTEKEITDMYLEEDIPVNLLLKWSKLLEYDFFRLYSQHLILYSPPSGIKYCDVTNNNSLLPQFRKNVYTIEIINFILEMLDKKIKTKAEIINEYKIPKSTLHKWIFKYR
ncbi:transposase [Chryseobacterium sp. ERMR1:04]|nr:hypothetical protein [Chryseobacterium sp. ERMR1:04]KPH15319.1 transposase [Chryseobacterium sp. ERMR1:04]